MKRWIGAVLAACLLALAAVPAAAQGRDVYKRQGLTTNDYNNIEKLIVNIYFSIRDGKKC